MVFIIFIDSTKLKNVWIKITTFKNVVVFIQTILIIIQKLLEHFPTRRSKRNTQRERKLGKFDLFARLLFAWRPLFINLKGFGTT